MRLKASFTIELLYVWFMIMFSIVFIISIAYKEHYMTSTHFLLHTAAEEIYHLESGLSLNSEEEICLKYKKIFNKERALKDIDLVWDNDIDAVVISGNLKNMLSEIKIKKYNPENHLRLMAVLEGVYERYKNRIQEGE